MIDIAYIQTPLGIASITGNEKGVQAVSILSDQKQKSSDNVPQSLSAVVTQLKEYFNGQRTDFDLILNPQGTEFQQKVWQELTKIPFGSTVTYLDMAKRLGDPKCIRAAATANGKNPLWIIVPCHRVIGSDGSLTGYAGGLWRKKWLLAHESPVKQQSLF